MAVNPTKAVLRQQQHLGKPATGLIGLGSKTRHTPQFAPRVQEQFFNRMSAQQVEGKRVGHVQAIKR